MANRYFVNGGVDSNWSTLGNWSTTSGGAGGSAIPLNTDDVFFDANSPNCTVNPSSRVALSINFTGYTNTITMSSDISVSGSMTFASAMTISGSGKFIGIAAGTHTSNGKVIPNLQLRGVVTHTLADAFVVTNYTLGNATNSTVVNGFSLEIQGDFTMECTSGTLSGTTPYTMTGPGTLTWPSTTGTLRNNFTINSSGTITVVAVSGCRFNTGTFAYIAGTVDFSAFNLNNSTIAGTYDLGGVTWGSVTFLASGTMAITLTSDLNVTGLYTVGSTTAILSVNGASINASGGMRVNSTTGTVGGTTVTKLTGTGTVDAPSLTTGRFLGPLEIDAGAGTITVSGLVNFDLSKVKYVSGTVITDQGTWASGGGSFKPAHPFFQQVIG